MASSSIPAGPSRVRIEQLINGVLERPGSFALVHSPPNWPYGDNPSSQSQSQSQRTNIAILDSSFNPPTLAHHSIASSSFPPPTLTSSESSTSPHAINSTESSTSPGPYTARLLLLSARNVEKTLKSTDTSLAQRVEMMLLQSQSMSSSSGSSSEAEGKKLKNVAVGLINEATFVNKAKIIRQWLKQRYLPSCSINSELDYDSSLEEWKRQDDKIDLTFLIGTDTLVRVFDPRFYPSEEEMYVLLNKFFSSPSTRQESKHKHKEKEGEGLGAYLISARRGISRTNRALESELLNRDGIKEYVDCGRIRLLGDGNQGWEEISSTRLRTAIKDGNKEEVLNLVDRGIAEYIEKEGLYK